jgi:hypothetical protein
MSLRHRSRCAGRLHTALALCLGFAVSLSAALAQDKPTLGAQSQVNVNKPAHFQTWRTITLGTHKGVDAYRDALDVTIVHFCSVAFRFENVTYRPN